jgi:mono/diheme cytochrome c family protein
MTLFFLLLPLFWLALGWPLPQRAQVTQSGNAFAPAVQQFFTAHCYDCHDAQTNAGNLNLAAQRTPAAVLQQRDQWEMVLQKIRTGEMPPKGLPRPSEAERLAVIAWLEQLFEQSDKQAKPDPGRVTARRLNRSEYTNTIRDLLAVDFRANQEFPSDDSGAGFDNIGDVLTISPVLMEKYMNAAERIAARAIGADPLPKKPLEAEYSRRASNLRQLDASTVEAAHRVDWDGEYTIRFGLPGERHKEAKPVTLAFYMDGKLLFSKPIETKPSGLVYFNPFSEEEIRVTLPEGDHVFRAAFLNDEFVKTLDKNAYFDNRKNKFIGSMIFVGPFASKTEKASRKKILICDPNTGPNAGKDCVEKIITTLAHRAYRRPVTKAEVATLLKLASTAKGGASEGLSVEQGLQVAIQAMLVSPHFLFRIERDLSPGDPTRIHKISDIELASRLSYFLWRSMPDDELLALAEKNKLHLPEVLNAQVKRMLDDEKSAALADNFAGQWLETRNLDVVKPDPQKFPSWGPELRDAMKTETRMFFEAILRENRPITDFLDARFTFLNERLARHYGIAGVTGADFRRVELATDQRGGILAHASVLTVSSYPTRTSPVIRGKYLLENILGTPPPPPPPNVPTLNEEEVGNASSLRQQLEKHRANPTCASCHNRMDTLGFGLENYDAIGRWRTMDGKFRIDSGGTFPNGKSFVTPAEMRTLLKDEVPNFSRCLTQKMLTYALGRTMERYDRVTVNDITRKLAASNYQFQTLIYEVVRSLPFQSRRSEASSKTDPVKTKEVTQR